MTKKKVRELIEDLQDKLKADKKAQQLLELLLQHIEKEPKQLGQNIDLPLPSSFINGDGELALFSDGACKGNPGPGAWAAIGQNSKGDLIFEQSGVDMTTTNNKMELEGALWALRQALTYLDVKKTTSKKIYLYTDSKYVVEGINSWLASWKKRGWRKADGKEILNLSLWQEMDLMLSHFSNLRLEWVKGHAGHPQNEKCDEMANMALKEVGL